MLILRRFLLEKILTGSEHAAVFSSKNRRNLNITPMREVRIFMGKGYIIFPVKMFLLLGC